MTDVPTALARPAFADDDAFERSLKDAVFWAPYARAALHAAGLPEDGDVRTHVPTTHVAALVGEDFLVKLHYEDWFGEDCYQTEREAYALLTGRDLPIPRLLGEGSLFGDGDGWRWPFLILSAMRGRSLRELDGTLTPGDVARAADFVGSTLKDLHATPTRDGEYLSLELYVDLIQTREQRCHRDHAQWGSLPEHLVSLVRDYVWGARKLIDPERGPHRLLHGDLHAGNVFLDGRPAEMTPTGIVDFNDAAVGDPHYDLVPVHTKALGCDKALLRRVLESYGWDDLGRRWPARMMALTLAHDYDMIQPVASRFPGALDRVETLDELARLLWDLDAPGLG